MTSIVRFLDKRLRLRVNSAKSAVSTPESRHFLGFSLSTGPWKDWTAVLPSKRSLQRVYDKVRALTPRNWGGTLKSCVSAINRYLTGWLGFFWVCTWHANGLLSNLDAHIRRRLRAIVLKQRKRKRSVVRLLVSLKVPARTARQVYSRRGIWAQTTLPAVQRGLKNSVFADLGLMSVYEAWKVRQAKLVSSPEQMQIGFRR